MKPSTLFAKAIVSVLVIGMASSSCTKDPEPVQEKTIVDLVVENSNFSLLATAVVHANLASTLAGQGPFTVFAPSNAAFIAAGLDTEDKIKALPAAAVSNILLYHVLGNAVPSTAIPQAANTAVTTVADADLYATRNENGVFINGASVVQADVMASNGYIHVIDQVLMPPSGNLVEALIDDARFSLLVAAVLRASEGSVNVAEVLMGTGPFTVFAPTNEAFMAAGFSSATDIQAADPNTLTSILTYHVLGARIFSSDLQNGATPTTVNGGNILINLNGGASVKGNGNANPATITQVNWLTSNGVIHVVDQVLLP